MGLTADVLDSRAKIEPMPGGKLFCGSKATRRNARCDRRGPPAASPRKGLPARPLAGLEYVKKTDSATVTRKPEADHEAEPERVGIIKFYY